ncbi:MAG TPA: STAS/SEC14 domain-containing protein [Rhizobiaceae bacterium]|nr:STAS/SEC14 domain-containing protein [Rhizobiaceae bacterium]
MPLHPLEPIPAIRRIETDRPDLFAVEISGHVAGSDVENLYGLLEGAYAIHDKIDLLIRVVDEDGFDREIASDTIEEGRAHARQHVRRCATIGNTRIASRIANIFSPSPQVELRHFSEDEEVEAWEWMGATRTEEEV